MTNVARSTQPKRPPRRRAESLVRRHGSPSPSGRNARATFFPPAPTTCAGFAGSRGIDRESDDATAAQPRSRTADPTCRPTAGARFPEPSETAGGSASPGTSHGGAQGTANRAGNRPSRTHRAGKQPREDASGWAEQFDRSRLAESPEPTHTHAPKTGRLTRGLCRTMRRAGFHPRSRLQLRRGFEPGDDRQ